MQVTWHAHKRPIDVNEEVFFLSPSFSLRWGGGGGGGGGGGRYLATYEWMMICFIKLINLGRSSKEL